MGPLKIALVFAATAATAAHAAPELLASARLDAGQGQVLTVRKVRAEDGVRIVVDDGTGSVWQSPALGSADKLFTLGGQATPLACADITGDGVPEVLVAAASPPRAATLTAYRYEGPGKLSPVPCAFPVEEVVRDGFVTDLAQDDGQDLAVLPDGRIRTLGRTYESAGIRKAGAARWYFVRSGDGFRFQKKEELVPEAP